MATAQWMEEDQEETETESESEEEPGDAGGAAATTADACVALRLVAAAAWFVVQERQVQEFPRVLALLAAVGEAAPDLVHYRHLAKLRLGLQAKVIMSMLEEKQSDGKIYDAIDTYFPEGEMLSHPHATVQDLKLVQVAQENFRDLVLGLLSDPKHREKYVQEHLENDYGECFLRVVEELFHDYLWQLESTLPEPHFEQLLEAAYIQGPSQFPQPDSSILSRYLSVMREQPAEAAGDMVLDSSSEGDSSFQENEYQCTRHNTLIPTFHEHLRDKGSRCAHAPPVT